MIKTLLSFTLIIFMSGCTITPVYEDIPKTEEDFKLSKDEILKKFPAIAAHHIENKGESSKHIPRYEDIVSYWGEPVAKETELFDYFWNKTYLISLGYVALEGLDEFIYFFGGMFIAIAPYPPETYTWEKGDYIIDTTCLEFPFKNEKYCMRWNWKNKQDKNSTIILPIKSDKNFYFKFTYSSGGDKIFKVANTDITHSIGFGTTLQLGYNYKLHQDTFNKIKFSAGIKYTGLIIPAAGAKLVEYPVDVVFYTKPSKLPLNLGLGIGYKVNPTLHNFSNDIDKFQLDNSLSFIIELESSLHNSSLRYEFVNYTGDGINSINGDTFSVSFSHYF